jgi:sugar phosphate isomerase/epimerase
VTLPLAGSNYGFLYDASRAESLRAIAEAGYELIELAACPPHLDLSELGPGERRAIAAEIERPDLRAVSVNPVELNPISENAQLKAATAHQYRVAIELAGELGAASVVMITGRRSPLIPVAEARARELLRAHLEALLPIAGPLGVTIALEPVPYGFLQTASDVAGFIDESGLQGVGIAADCANLLVVGADPAQEVRANGERVAIAHVSDSWRARWAHTQIGRGEIDFEAFARALSDISYSGPTIYELVDGEDPGPRLRGDRDALRERGWT